MGRVRGDHDCGFLRRIWRRGIGIACAAAAVMSLTSCVPQGKAVGDTQESEPEIAHEGVQRQDIVVGVIGSVDTGLDSDVLNAFNKAGPPTYPPAWSTIRMPPRSTECGPWSRARSPSS